MPTYDPNAVPKDDGVVPDGEYLCECVKATEATTKNNDPMIKLQWAILSGDYARRIFFDQLVFNEGGLKRVRVVLKRFGFDTSKPINVDASFFLGKQAICKVKAQEEEYMGEKTIRSRIVFDGYSRDVGQAQKLVEAVASQAAPAARPLEVSEGELPF